MTKAARVTQFDHIDDPSLKALVGLFYDRVRRDDLIGPLFNDAIGDWPVHLEKLAAFWSSVMLSSGQYKGQPVPAHFRHRERIEPQMFERWLALWRQTTAELFAAPAAAALQAKAERIAESLSLALYFTLEPSTAGRAPAFG
jgi:hemoglobin